MNTINKLQKVLETHIYTAFLKMSILGQIGKEINSCPILPPGGSYK